jgi:hypothetical protein
MGTTVEVLPPVDPVVATSVLAEVDNLINWKNNAVEKLERAGIRLSRHIADVSQCCYWMVRGFKSETKYVDKTFPNTREQYSILRRIGIELKEYPISLLEEIGVSKCQDLVRIKRKDGCIHTNWFIWARTESRDFFRRRVRAYMGNALPPAKFEDYEIIHLKVWLDTKPIVDRALEIAMKIGNCHSRSDAFCNIICPEFISTYNENDEISENNFHLEMITRHLDKLKMEHDPTVIDRLIGIIRVGLADKKDGDGTSKHQPLEE